MAEKKDDQKSLISGSFKEISKFLKMKEASYAQSRNSISSYNSINDKNSSENRDDINIGSLRSKTNINPNIYKISVTGSSNFNPAKAHLSANPSIKINNERDKPSLMKSKERKMEVRRNSKATSKNEIPRLKGDFGGESLVVKLKYEFIDEDGVKSYDNFKLLKKTGRGTMHYISGNKLFEGYVKDGKYEGYGILYHTNGTQYYEGAWKNDKFDGYGVEYDEHEKKRFAKRIFNELIKSRDYLSF